MFIEIFHKVIAKNKEFRQTKFKQSNCHKMSNPKLYKDLEPSEHVNRSAWIISELRANRANSKQFNSNTISVIDAQQQLFTVKSKQNEHRVSIRDGYCNCQYFTLKRIPCKQMYGVINTVKEYSFASLPSQLLNDTHMTLNIRLPNNQI